MIYTFFLLKIDFVFYLYKKTVDKKYENYVIFIVIIKDTKTGYNYTTLNLLLLLVYY